MFSKDQMLGKYQIIERLGAGGFGTVYLAVDRLLNRKVALKVPHQQIDEAAFLREPQIMVKLKHDNIVELITVEKQDGIFFMVMEYIEGDSLDKQIRQERGLQSQRALDIAIGVCKAIKAAHSEKIIHRDLRPANILLTKDGTPKVTDFGTSRLLELNVEDFARTRIGSPPYMAPEHFRGQTVFQSDIWSLGISIYEMLTGTVPFYDVDPIKIAQAVSTRPIVSPHLRNPQVSKAFSDVVMKALSVNLGDRYISAYELLKALEGLKETDQRKTRQITPNMAASGSSATYPSSGQTGKQCPFCFKLLSRLASSCPYCGEKV
ncbi:MAG: serine/threonine protein kinase [Holophagales bacterium]|nr:serine/threonine protein kinase [Holophagales bacterium]